MPSVPTCARLGAAALFVPALACSPPTSAPVGAAPAATSPAITAGDLQQRLSIFADDSMQGRKAGTPGNAKGTEYIAAEARRIGLQPAGDSGGFFQTVPLVERSLADAASVTAGGASFVPFTDFIPRDQGKGARAIDGVQVVDGGVLGDSARPAIPPEQARGKLVVLHVAPGTGGTPTGTVNRAGVSARFGSAAGIAVATMDAIGRTDRDDLAQSGAQLAKVDAPDAPAFMYVTQRMAAALLSAGTVRGTIAFADGATAAPARNVVAILPGSDPALRGELVAVGAHNDHIGMAPEPAEHDSLRAFDRVMRPRGVEDTPGTPTAEQSTAIRTILDSLRRSRPARPDSIFNGADDDGSGSVSVLEIAEALAHSPTRPRRSILHPDNSYCRSDHYMYARFGIPITFFTTGGHMDYHMLTDEVQYIDFPKMARVAGLVEDVARHVADLDHRIVVDKPKPDPEGICKQ